STGGFGPDFRGPWRRRPPLRNRVHDNWLHAHAIDHERGRIVLHTVYPHGESPEYTDVGFEGLVVHHFEQQQCGGCPYPANVLLEVEEAEPHRSAPPQPIREQRGRPCQTYLYNLASTRSLSSPSCSISRSWGGERQKYLTSRTAKACVRDYRGGR